MRIVHVRREEMVLGVSHDGAAASYFKRCFDHDNDLEWPWHFIDSVIFPPGSGIGHHTHTNAEEIFISVDNAMQFTHNGRTAEVVGGAAVPLRSGESHGIYNHTDQDTLFFNFHCFDSSREPSSEDYGDTRVGVQLESTDRLPVGRLDRALLAPVCCHSGKGEVGFREVWGTRDFSTNFEYLNHLLLPPGTSVGYHRHDGVQEAYIIMHGGGRVTVDDETDEVARGDVIPNRLGGAHGIFNHGSADLELFVVGVSRTKGRVDATELRDDLAAR
ncbi:MAG: cupin domain-containing protein [Spirochaetaceae bacterium]|nr:cupin domain-containing protein [Spirochaetaceae bacterium]